MSNNEHIYTLKEIEQFSDLNKELYALIGNPVTKSKGAIIHNFVMQQLNIYATYIKICLNEKELPEFFSLIKKLPFSGLSVTMPFKEKVLPFVHYLSDTAKSIGAVNTIHIEKDVFHGYNTDGIGAISCFFNKFDLNESKIIILGCGGAAKAIAYTAVKNGAMVTILNRTLQKAEEFANKINARADSLENISEYCKQGYHALIDCTPLLRPTSFAHLLPHAFFMDIKSQVLPGSLIENAIAAGYPVIKGKSMWINQAVEQWKIWKKDIDEQKVLSLIKRKLNE